MKRIVLAFFLVGAIGRSAEARPAPRPVAQHGRAIHPIPPEPRHTFVWFLVNWFVVPAAKGAVETAVRGAICAAL
jgi:hypothetical protein